MHVKGVMIIDDVRDVAADDDVRVNDDVMTYLVVDDDVRNNDDVLTMKHDR